MNVLQLVQDGFSQLGWALGFYLSSAALVLLAFGPAVAHCIAIIADKKILAIPLNAGSQLLVVVGRILFVLAALLVGGYLTFGQINSGSEWFSTLELLFTSFSINLAATLVVLCTGLLVLWGLYALCAVLFTEYRTAQLIERMQRSVPAWKVRRSILVLLADLILWPVGVVFFLHLVEFI